MSLSTTTRMPRGLFFRAYQQAGLDLPIIIADGADNGFFKDCEQARTKNPKFRAFSCTQTLGIPGSV